MRRTRLLLLSRLPLLIDNILSDEAVDNGKAGVRVQFRTFSVIQRFVFYA